MRWWPGPAQAAIMEQGLAVFARKKMGKRYDWYLLQVDGSPRILSENLRAPSGNLLYADGSSITIEADNGVFEISASGAMRNLIPENVRIAGPVSGRLFSTHGWSGEIWLGYPGTRVTQRTVGDFVVENASGDGDAALIVVSYDTKETSPILPIGIDGARTLALSRSGRKAVATVKVGAATKLLLFTMGAAPRELVRLNEHLDQIDRPLSRPVTYSLKDPNHKAEMRQMNGCILLPTGYESGKRYPLALEMYPSGAPGTCKTLADVPRVDAFAPDLWTSRGFIYFRPAVPLDFVDTGNDPMGGLGAVFDQTVSELSTQGLIDADRVVLFGFSQGGIASLVTATQSDRPAATIAINGWSDYFSHYFGPRGLMRYFHLDENGGDERWRYECDLMGDSHLCPFGFGASALDEPARFASVSPVARARDISSPIMLVHSDLDYIDIGQYDEMFGALYRAGKFARYIRYWGEGHGPSSPDNIRDLWRRIDGFLAETGVIDSEDVNLATSLTQPRDQSLARSSIAKATPQYRNRQSSSYRRCRP